MPYLVRWLSLPLLLLALWVLPAQAVAQERTHTVASGEYLGLIAERYGVSVQQIRQANNLSSDEIRIGQTLRIPAASGASSSGAQRSHTVASGEYLGLIAERHGVSVQQLREANNLRDDRIQVGQTLRIPAGGGASVGSNPGRYRVQSGDTLGGIAQRHNVSLQDLVAWNPRINPDRLQVGQEIEIRAGGRATHTLTHVVQRGEIAGRIAERYGVRVADLREWNPRVNVDRIGVGQELRIVLRGPEVPSESVGQAFGGQLVNAEQLPPHRAYTIRSLRRAWGTNWTIGAIIDGFEHMRQRFSQLPILEIHDISAENGGQISDHRSHQSGRDADMGYYHSGCRQSCPYRRIRGRELDAEKTWALFSYWISRDLVEFIFMDYELQEQLYNWLRDEQHASRDQLARWIQYPRGRNTRTGIIRHARNHADHFHVRFSCDPRDARCR